MSGEKTLSQNCFKQLEVEIYFDKTDNLLKLEHHAGFKELSRSITKTAAANITLPLVLTKKSELNLNDKDVFPQVCINVL